MKRSPVSKRGRLPGIFVLYNRQWLHACFKHRAQANRKVTGNHWKVPRPERLTPHAVSLVHRALACIAREQRFDVFPSGAGMAADFAVIGKDLANQADLALAMGFVKRNLVRRRIFALQAITQIGHFTLQLAQAIPVIGLSGFKHLAGEPTPLIHTG